MMETNSLDHPEHRHSKEIHVLIPRSGVAYGSPTKFPHRRREVHGEAQIRAFQRGDHPSTSEREILALRSPQNFRMRIFGNLEIFKF